MRKNKLYTVNKYNKHGFMFQGLDDKPENLYGFGSAFMKASGLGNLKQMFSAEGIGNSLGQFVGDMFGTSTFKGVSANPETEGTTGNGGVNTTPPNTNSGTLEEAGVDPTVVANIKQAYGGPVYRTPKGNLHFLGGISGGLASAVGGAIGGAISGGNTSTVGSVVDKVGDVVGAIPGFGTIAGAGLKVLSGGINALFGSKVDQAKLQAANKGTNAYNSFTSNAKTFDDVKMAQAQAGVQDAYSGGLFVKGAAAEKNKRLHDQRVAARQFAANAVANNISNLQSDQINDALANFSAFGGPLGAISGALGLMQQDRYFDTIDNRSAALEKDKPDSVKMATSPSNNSIFANGGDLEGSFLDEFGSDPIAAAIRYSKGIERREAEKQAAAEQAAREAEYMQLQNQLASLQTQNMGLQSIIDAMPSQSVPDIPEVQEVQEYSSPSVAASGTPSGNATWDYIEDQLRRSGRFNDTQIQGIKYNLQRESSIDPTVVGDGGAAFGLGQWHGSRKPKDMSLEGQTRHLIDTISNFDGKEHWIRRSDYEGFLNARTPEEAHYYLAKGYERPRADIVAKVKRDSDMSLKNIHAFGGELGTNGTDFTNGLLYIDEGDTHERNPLDGVPMGVDAEGIPNLVEEGETVYNNYVFSDRMKVPGFMYKELGLGGIVKKKHGKEMSFADASKKLARESEQRPNDPISQAGLEAALAKLAEVQETERSRKQMEETVGLGIEPQQFGLGGNLFGGGGYAYQWVSENHPNLSEHQKRQIAEIMEKRIARKYPNVETNPSNINYETFYDNLAPFWDTSEENIEKHYRALVEDGMNPNTALNVVARAVDGKSGGIQNKDKWIERYKKWNAKSSSSKTKAEKTAKAVETQQSQKPAASPSATPAAASTTVSAEKPKGSSGGGSKGTKGSTGTDSNKNYDGVHATDYNPVHYTGGNPYPTSAPYPRDTPATPRGAETQGAGYLAADLGTTTQEVLDQGIQQAGQKAAEKVTEQRSGQDTYNPYPTWMRHAPVVGSGLAVLTDTLGLTNKADYSNVAGLEAAANAAGYTPNVTYDPIGNYLRYNPMDIWYQQNALNAQARATDRALLNSSSPSRAAGLLANGYNSQLASGNLYRQALEYNDAQKKEVEDFNRKTNMFNSQMGLEAAMANARYRQQGLSAQMSGLATAAKMKDDIDARASAARSANLTNFFDSLGDIGRENFAYNMVNSTAAANNGYGYSSRNGSVTHRTFGGKIKKRKR